MRIPRVAWTARLTVTLLQRTARKVLKREGLRRVPMP